MQKVQEEKDDNPILQSTILEFVGRKAKAKVKKKVVGEKVQQWE